MNLMIIVHIYLFYFKRTLPESQNEDIQSIFYTLGYWSSFLFYASFSGISIHEMTCSVFGPARIEYQFAGNI